MHNYRGIVSINNAGLPAIGRERMKIGVPKEIKTLEFRVGMTPAGVRELVHDGHEVIEQTRSKEIDVLILDLKMPLFGGLGPTGQYGGLRWLGINRISDSRMPHCAGAIVAIARPALSMRAA